MEDRQKPAAHTIKQWYERLRFFTPLPGLLLIGQELLFRRSNFPAEGGFRSSARSLLIRQKNPILHGLSHIFCSPRRYFLLLKVDQRNRIERIPFELRIPVQDRGKLFPCHGFGGAVGTVAKSEDDLVRCGPLHTGGVNDVIAVESSAVFFFDVKRVITTCSSACRFHSMVVQNLFFAISEKNRSLVQKLDYLSRRSTREKLISYLSEEAKKQNSAYITIPFNHQQLADYLSVDRSAMSNELCKMRDDGLLEFEKNRFKLRK